MLQRLQEQQAATECITATLMESKDTHLMPEGFEVNGKSLINL